MMKSKLIFFLLVILSIFGSGSMASAEDYRSDFEAVSYDMASGLTSLEINAIAQTNDGYIWVGSYSGLYRYDGVNFEEVALDSKIRNVMVLYTDSRNRLWIGTNDSGILCYNPVNSKISTFSVENGLSSNAIRSVSEDNEGNIYVGTGSFLSVITQEERVVTYSSLTDITYVRKLANFQNGIIAGVTNSGAVFFMDGDKIIAAVNLPENSGVYFTSCCAAGNRSYILGDSAGSLYQCDLSMSGGQWAAEVEIACKDTKIGGISNIVGGKNQKYLIRLRIHLLKFL